MGIEIKTRYPKQILEEMEKDKPSSDPAYWAKKGCKKCYGRGIVGSLTSVVGKNNTIKQQQLCSCVSKAFAQWQDQWYAEHKAKEPLSVSALNSPGAIGEDQKGGPVSPANRVRILDLAIKPFRDKISQLQQRKEELRCLFSIESQESAVAEADNQVRQQQARITDHENRIQCLEAELARTESIRDELRRKINDCKTLVRSELARNLEDKEKDLKYCREQLEKVEGEFTKQEHHISKKIRELFDKIDRLEMRRHKILKESGLLTDIIEESSDPS